MPKGVAMRRRGPSPLFLGVLILGGLMLVAAGGFALVALWRVLPDHAITQLFSRRNPATPARTIPQPATSAPAPKVASTPAPKAGSEPTALTPTAARPDRFVRPFALWRDIHYDLDAMTADQPQPFQESRQITGDLQYIDGATFRTDTLVVRLSGITSLPREAICLAANKTKFACGLQARASLSLLVASERPRCYPDVSMATAEPAYLCTSRGRLLSSAQIEAGFALPSQPSIERYVEIATAARANHAGAWDGDWTSATTGAAP